MLFLSHAVLFRYGSKQRKGAVSHLQNSAGMWHFCVRCSGVWFFQGCVLRVLVAWLVPSSVIFVKLLVWQQRHRWLLLW